MPQYPEQFDELAELLTSMSDTGLSSPQARRLADLMRGDPAAQRLYLDYVELHTMLVWQHREGCDECGMVNDERGLDASVLSRASVLPPISDLPIQPSSFSVQHLSSFSSLAFSYSLAAVIVGVGLLVAWAWKVSDHVSVAVHAVPRVVPTIQFVGRITGMVDCRLAHPTTGNPGPVAVPLGRTYDLASGLLEITYDTGARVVLEGPCTYEVDSAAGGYLSVGKLVARVEKRGEGRGARGEGAANPKSPIPNSTLSTTHYPLFTVTTPTATVTDLGTEFGVEVDREGVTSSYVFEGKVKVQTDNGQPAREFVLGVNDSLRVQRPSTTVDPASTIQKGTGRPDGFIRVDEFGQLSERKPQASSSFDRWQTFSNECRKRSDLLLYYDFTPDGDLSVLPNRASTGRRFDGQVLGGEWVEGRFRGKNALKTGWPGSGIRVPLVGEYRQITMVVWTNIDRIGSRPTGLFLTDPLEPGPHWVIRSDGAMAFAFRTWNRDVRSTPDIGEHLGEWTMLSVSVDMDAQVVAFYLNGEPIGRGKTLNSDTITFHSANLGSYNAKGDERLLNGRIDEVMIFRSALSNEEIQSVYRASTSTVRERR